MPVLAYADDRAAGGEAGRSAVCIVRARDTDADRIPDPVETRLGTNPNLTDSDGDGRDDGLEILVDGTDPAGCDDGLRGGSETDVDCGGSCPPCGLGLVCSALRLPDRELRERPMSTRCSMR